MNSSLRYDEQNSLKEGSAELVIDPCYKNEAKAVLENAKTVHAAGIIECPILMFVSDGRQVSSGWIEYEKTFAEQTNAKTVFLNCGHYIHYYESERISREIRAFVNQTVEYGKK